MAGRYMRLHLIGFNLHRLRFLGASLPLLLIFVTAIMLLIMPPANVTASRLSQATRVSTLSPALSPTIVASPTVPNSVKPSSQDSQAQQILSVAQNDVSIANTIIYYSGIILAIMTFLATLAGILGVREFFRRMQRLRTETETSIQWLTTNTETHIQQLVSIERQFREQLEQHVEHAERESQKLEERLEQFTT